MRIINITVLFALFAISLIGCGGAKDLQSASECDMPEWYLNVPHDPNYIFSAKTATSQDMQLSLDKATADGRTEIGRQTDLKVQGLQKKFEEETGVANEAQLMLQFTQASKTVVSTSLSGSRVKNQKLCKDGSIWRAYVLVEYPIGAANEAMMQQIKKNNDMYTRFRASETYKELNEEVQKYEEWKKQQGVQSTETK